MWLILTSGSDTEADTKCNRLDNVYKVLLAPSTFFILISWLFQTHMWSLYLEHPQLRLTLEVTEKDLLNPLVFLTYVAGALGISVILFLVVIFVRGRKGLVGRFVAFWLLLFAFTLTTGSFIQAMFPFILVPLPTGPASGWIILGMFIILSGMLSGYLVWKAK